MALFGLLGLILEGQEDQGEVKELREDPPSCFKSPGAPGLPFSSSFGSLKVHQAIPIHQGILMKPALGAREALYLPSGALKRREGFN